MAADEVDVVVIGTGPGGEALAQGCAGAGLRVVAVEQHLVGGECPYYGCIPTKMMVRAAGAVAEARRAGELAGGVSVRTSWSPVVDRVREATSDWDDAAAVRRLEDAGATVVHGRGRLDGPGRVRITPADGSPERVVTARRGVVLDPGTRPAAPPVPGLADGPYWTNRDAVRVTELPASLVILGGGPIGSELGQVFARFGVEVTIVQRNRRLLPRDEPEASRVLEDVFARDGIRVLTDAETVTVRHTAHGVTLTLAEGEPIEAERLLVAAGRTLNLDDLGLESVGLSPDRVEVDDHLRAADGLWILGDVVGSGAFTHVSMYQSEIAQRDLLGQDGPPARDDAVPHVTFTDPEVAGVGLSEAQAVERGLRVRTATGGLGSRGYTHGPGADGLVKLVADAERRVLVGGTVVGPAAGEVLAMLTLAVHAAVPLDTLHTMIGAFPTFHRAVTAALADLP